MAHGTHCHCIMCTVGKKMGMIRGEQQDDHKEYDHNHHDVCKRCGHAHKEDDHCDCGCK